MRNLLVMVLFPLCIGPPAGNGQSSYDDVLYLKNGSIIRGLVVEVVPDSSVKIQTRDGSVFAYSMAEVDRIAKEQPVQRMDTPEKSSSEARLAFLVGYGTEDWYNVGFGIRLGGRLPSGLYAGGTFVYHLGKSQDLNLGYGFGSITITLRTLYVGPELGYDAMVSEQVSMRPYASFGYFSLLASAEAGGSSASDSEARFYIAPGLLFNTHLSNRSTLGFDARYVIVTGEGGSEVGAFGAFLCLGFSL